MKKAELEREPITHLIMLCNDHGLDPTGDKETLIARLSGKGKTKPEPEVEPPEPSEPETEPAETEPETEPAEPETDPAGETAAEPGGEVGETDPPEE
ncbi:hypothetical protein LCGC14_2605210 [marine sediment metagenome]|uniref:SAP domain-containing protein n=1 Tax=marine sediment metagenome TaxID=412755 RepID=A0A0F9A7H1_9ZZZZ